VSFEPEASPTGEPAGAKPTKLWRRLWRRRPAEAVKKEVEVDPLAIVSKRLIIVTLLMLGLTVALFLIPLFLQNRFPLSWFCFGVGILGGFVSIQQRLRLLSSVELALLAQSWVHILIIPLFGGIFALVFYLLVLAGILDGTLFPRFSMQKFANPSTTQDLIRFFLQTYPASGQDFAKLAFWAFVAGFSERWIPDMIKGKIDAGRT